MCGVKLGTMPAAYPQEIRDEVLERVAAGESLVTICKSDGMPKLTAVFGWLAADKEYADKYARAKSLCLEAWAEETIHIANTPVQGVTRTVKADGGVEEKTADMIEHRRLQIETRKWMLAKLAPKKYGDKQHIEHSGGFTGLTDDALQARIDALKKKLADGDKG